ncbi:hypothetical protein D7X25_20235 [bacterium 1XD42-8]|jgi:putative transposase|nr:hypothetical protein D7X25_20235 [bacterium 1XD42-8]
MKGFLSELWEFARVPRSAYYQWIDQKTRANEKFNQKLCALIKDVYEEKNGIVRFRQKIMFQERALSIMIFGS